MREQILKCQCGGEGVMEWRPPYYSRAGTYQDVSIDCTGKGCLRWVSIGITPVKPEDSKVKEYEKLVTETWNKLQNGI